jgi:hypothetical protein
MMTIESIQHRQRSLLDHVDNDVGVEQIPQHGAAYRLSRSAWVWLARSDMKSGVGMVEPKKKLSQEEVAGEIILSSPLLRTSTFFTESGKRISAGKRTACVRLLLNTVVVDM